MEVAAAVLTRPADVRIAMAADSIVILTGGTKSDLNEGDTLDIVGGVGETKDPASGEVLQRSRPRGARVQITRIHENYAEVRIVGELAVKLSAGDRAASVTSKTSVLVASVVDGQGKPTQMGAGLLDELAKSLSGKCV